MNFKNIQQPVRTFSLTEGEDGVILPAAKTTPSIAVLPFANMSHDAGDEYFSDGLAEEIINALAQVSGLKVIARTSAFAFKGKNEDIRKIAETLGVVNVLEGSVRRAENRLRVTAQLIQAQDGSHLWSHRYDREMTDVFAMQDEIATAITDALRVKLFASHHRYEPTLPSYEAYLKALSIMVRRKPLNPSIKARSFMSKQLHLIQTSLSVTLDSPITCCVLCSLRVSCPPTKPYRKSVR